MEIILFLIKEFSDTLFDKTVDIVFRNTPDSYVDGLIEFVVNLLTDISHLFVDFFVNYFPEPYMKFYENL